MSSDDTAAASERRSAFVAAFIATHSVTIPRFRRDNFRPLPGAAHPLYGPLAPGITDGITAWALTLDGRLVHVAHGQLDIAHEPYHGPRRGTKTTRTSGPRSPKTPKPKLDTTDLY